MEFSAFFSCKFFLPPGLHLQHCWQRLSLSTGQEPRILFRFLLKAQHTPVQLVCWWFSKHSPSQITRKSMGSRSQIRFYQLLRKRKKYIFSERHKLSGAPQPVRMRSGSLTPFTLWLGTALPHPLVSTFLFPTACFCHSKIHYET